MIIVNLHDKGGRFLKEKMINGKKEDMIKEQNKYSELTGKINGCCMEVHNALADGFQEVIFSLLVKENNFSIIIFI